jgi:hypothetical protein
MDTYLNKHKIKVFDFCKNTEDREEIFTTKIHKEERN